MHNKHTRLVHAPSQQSERLTSSKEHYLSLVPANNCPISIPAGEAASYIADLLESLQTMAADAELNVLHDLIHVAKEEARINGS